MVKALVGKAFEWKRVKQKPYKLKKTKKTKRSKKIEGKKEKG